MYSVLTKTAIGTIIALSINAIVYTNATKSHQETIFMMSIVFLWCAVFMLLGYFLSYLTGFSSNEFLYTIAMLFVVSNAIMMMFVLFYFLFIFQNNLLLEDLHLIYS